jgi:CheY-like chemotaxis protein
MARVLVVDDEANIRELLSRFFSMCDHDVRSAASGVEALEIIRNEKPFEGRSDRLADGRDGRPGAAERRKESVAGIDGHPDDRIRKHR